MQCQILSEKVLNRKGQLWAMKGLMWELVQWDGAQMMKLDDEAEARQAVWSSQTSVLQGTGSAWQTHSVYKVRNLFLKYTMTQVNQSHGYLQRMILLLKDKEALFWWWHEIYLHAFSSPSQKDLNLSGSGQSCLLVCNRPAPLMSVHLTASHGTLGTSCPDPWNKETGNVEAGLRDAW